MFLRQKWNQRKKACDSKNDKSSNVNQTFQVKCDFENKFILN